MTERKRLMGLICKGIAYALEQMNDEGVDFAYGDIADFLLANCVIVPPCKVGQTVYMLSRGKIIPMIVNSISFNGSCEYMLNCRFEDEETHGYSLITFTEKTRDYYWALTREEAEKALERSRG